MSQCLPGSSTPAKVLFFQTSARSCWATVIRLIVMSLSFFFHSPNTAAGLSSGGNSRISPKPPRAYRTGIAFFVAVAGGKSVVIVRASLAQTLLRLLSRRTGRTRNIDAQAWYALRCDAAHSREQHQGSLGRFGCGTFVPRLRMPLASKGGLEPQALRPCQ